MQKVINELRADIELQTVEVTTSPARTWKDGIRMIPAIRCGDQIMAGFTLPKPAISSFLEENCANS